ncbi:MAG: tRNA lysidine(34) synthetase TilS [Planctomycetia bacterium]|nr:tRNA lysidine(34) synthetase TilS [Planctomycetia bacterium]
MHKHKVAGPILLAVSGGPDSVCLLYAMMQLVDKNTLHIAHYNHRLRGEASDADGRYVESLCQQHGLHFHLGHSDQLSPQQSGIENCARKLRYDWLTEVARQNGCNWVMTGHTMNDQSETVLHHLIRGTGWRGLRGIAPKRRLTITDHSIYVLRPLLTCTRQDVLDYLASHNITARHDASNDDIKFTRNRIRHQIMPQLIEMNPDAVNHLAEWADRARMVYRQIKTESRRLFETIIAFQSKERLALKLKLLERNSNTVMQEVLRGLFQSQNWPIDQMNHQRWKEVIEVCRGTRTAVELPGRIMVTRRDLVVQFIKR